jgi:NAD(P)H-dependent flavin oxidoreductase YrpB (nitropropane dioxygenase family)/catechol 2,3-dioxygenase-like lactoylglutathione lyase family enzyme
MFSASSDPVIDEGYRYGGTAPPDIPALGTRLTREYGLRYPFVGAGMGFIAHEHLAAAVTNAGGLGVLGANPDPADSLPTMVERLRALTSGSFGVDLICAVTGMGPACTDEHIDACIQLDVPLVVFHHDPPPAPWVSALRGAGARVWMQASSPEIAAISVGLGVDGIVAQGSEAGGHARGQMPLHALLKTIRRSWPDVLLLAAGGISDGTAAAAALRAGAEGVWVGTALVVAAEANAHPEYQRRLIESSGTTLRPTVFGPEWPDQLYRLLATPAVRDAEATAHTADPRQHHTIGRTRLWPHSANIAYDLPFRSALPPTRDTSGDWESMVYPAGEGVGAVRRIAPAAEIIEKMMSQAYGALCSGNPPLAVRSTNSPPTFSRVSHISFSVRDAEASAQWWAELLELAEIGRVTGDGWRGIVLMHRRSRTMFELQQHDGNRGESFDPLRTGFDHMGFKVDARAELDEWLVRFEHLGVIHSPIAEREYGAVLTFKDPDGIQFEMFFKADHP